MKTLVLELRDRATFIPILAVDMNPDAFGGSSQHYLLRRCGYPCDGQPNVLITRLDGSGGRACNDPYYWNDRTFRVAHEWIIANWHELENGSVVDVEFILGETKTPKISERFQEL
jgi:hypothetical protein